MLPAITRFGGAGAVARRLGFKCAGVVYAADGHAVFSYYEMVTDNILFSYKVPHKREPLIVKGKKYRADFKVGDVYIECLGYINKKDKRGDYYRKRWAEKVQIYNNEGKRFIALYPKDFSNKAKGARMALAALVDEYKEVETPVIDIGEITRPKGFYAEWKNIEKDLRRVIALLGRFPTAKDLERLRLFTLSIYIRKYHGGGHAVAKRMGFPLECNPPKYLQEIENIMGILRPIYEKLRRMPTADELRSKKYGERTDIVTAIYEYHGGLGSVAKRIGWPMKGKGGSRSKCRLENVKSVLLPICRKLGRMPTAEELRSKVYGPESDVVSCLYKYYGGISGISLILGYSIKRKGCKEINGLNGMPLLKGLGAPAE